MELNAKAFTFGAVAAFGIAYIVCTLFVLFLPDLTTQLAGWLMHSTSVEIAEITLIGFLAGLIQVIIYTGLTSWFFVFLYNRFKK